MTKEDMLEVLTPFTDDIRIMMLAADGKPCDVTPVYQWHNDEAVIVLVSVPIDNRI